jgi:hypothetical protein
VAEWQRRATDSAGDNVHRIAWIYATTKIQIDLMIVIWTNLPNETPVQQQNAVSFGEAGHRRVGNPACHRR